jgi:hypothetical protein
MAWKREELALRVLRVVPVPLGVAFLWPNYFEAAETDADGGERELRELSVAFCPIPADRCELFSSGSSDDASAQDEDECESFLFVRLRGSPGRRTDSAVEVDLAFGPLADVRAAPVPRRTHTASAREALFSGSLETIESKNRGVSSSPSGSQELGYRHDDADYDVVSLDHPDEDLLCEPTDYHPLMDSRPLCFPRRCSRFCSFWFMPGQFYTWRGFRFSAVWADGHPSLMVEGFGARVKAVRLEG